MTTIRQLNEAFDRLVESRGQFRLPNLIKYDPESQVKRTQSDAASDVVSKKAGQDIERAKKQNKPAGAFKDVDNQRATAYSSDEQSRTHESVHWALRKVEEIYGTKPFMNLRRELHKMIPSNVKIIIKSYVKAMGYRKGQRRNEILTYLHDLISGDEVHKDNIKRLIKNNAEKLIDSLPDYDDPKAVLLDIEDDLADRRKRHFAPYVASELLDRIDDFDNVDQLDPKRVARDIYRDLNTQMKRAWKKVIEKAKRIEPSDIGA